MTNFRPAF